MPPTPPSRSTTRSLGAWSVSAAQARAVLLVGTTAVAAVLGHRPDLLVIVAPLLVVAVHAQVRRPRGEATATAVLTDATLREGETTPLVVTVEGAPDDGDGVMLLATAPFVEREPGNGVVPLEDGRAVIGVRSTRWGRRRTGTVSVSVSSVWGAYQAGPTDVPDHESTTLPVPARFEASAPTPHPRGIVGLNRSARAGSGTEFATIRPFHAGDRLRRIHWATSLRTGELHVTSTYSDEDAHVTLIVDAFSDLGPREGIDGRPTSLDATVRAAGAMSEHFLRTGDRLSLRTVGAADIPPLGVGSGTGHLRRVLETLAAITPASERRDDGRHAVTGIDAHSLCIVLSPLIDPTMTTLAHTLAGRGMTTVVVDTFPSHLVQDSFGASGALAWRIRLLARDSQVQGLRSRGVPVVPWEGPGSLDPVLRGIARRAAAPRRGRR